MPSGLRVVFLDRDGTINEDFGYVHQIANWKFNPLAVDALVKLHAAGFVLAIVSNQSGVGTGKYSEADVEALHAWVAVQLMNAGAPISAIAYCPHSPEARCTCRKPSIGLAAQIEQKLGRPIDYAGSWTIGDKPSDASFGIALGTRSILLRSRYWGPSDSIPPQTLVADSLIQASELIVGSA